MRCPPHLPLLAAVLLATTASAQSIRIKPNVAAMTSFAIVVDLATWQAVPDAIRHYRDAVEADGLPTWILADAWSHPEAVRDALRELRQGPSPLEGAILIGQIPIAMIRGAQHLTTSFKMNEDRYTWDRSSVPSDRFYDDFDLVFTPLEHDADVDRPLLHYYRLAPTSAQRIDKDIYTARLLPPGADDAARHAAIAACLERFTVRDGKAPRLDHVLALMGHGYVSESLAAWHDGLAMLSENLPALRRPGGALIALHHERDQELEATLLRELAAPDLDLAILHSHGDDDRQYLTGAPPLPSAVHQVAALRRYLRQQLRKARAQGKDEAEVQQKFAARWQLSHEWFATAFDAEVTAADEAFEAAKELEASEVRSIACGAEVIDLDSCFNGAFTAKDYQAAAYLFGDGHTRAVVANSVNVGQDVCSDRNLHRLANGERVGRWHQARPHLESHLFGDPTFRFAATRDTEAARRQAKLRAAGPARTPQQRSNDAIAGHSTYNPLFRPMVQDAAATVRLEALAQLAGQTDRRILHIALPLAATDPSALIRRMAVSLMGDVGDPAYLPPLLHAALRDSCNRVAYQARGALAKYDPEAVAAAFDAAVDNLPTPFQGDRAPLLRRMQTAGFIAEYRQEANDRELELKKRVRAVRTFRLYRVHAVIPELIALANATDDDPAVRIAALDSLGWFHYSTQFDIAAAVKAIADDENTPVAVRGEASKTLRRLATGPNDPLMP